MHEDHGQHIGWRSWALRSGLTLAWLAMLMLLPGRGRGYRRLPGRRPVTAAHARRHLALPGQSFNKGLRNQ